MHIERSFIEYYTLTRNRRNVKDCIVLWSKVNLSIKERPPTSRAAACWSLQQSLAARASITRCFVKALIVVTASSLYVSTNWKCFWRSRPEMMDTSLSCSLRTYKWFYWEEMYRGSFTMIQYNIVCVLTPSKTVFSSPNGLLRSAVAYLWNSVDSILSTNFSISVNWELKCLRNVNNIR